MATRKKALSLRAIKAKLQETESLLLAVGARADKQIQELRREVSNLKAKLNTVTAQRNRLLSALEASVKDTQRVREATADPLWFPRPCKQTMIEAAYAIEFAKSSDVDTLETKKG